MAADVTRRVIVTGLELLTNSTNGNPRYRIHTEDAGPFTTMSDAGFCYGIENDRVRGERRQEATLTLTRAGRVRDLQWHPVIGSHWPRNCDHDRDTCSECITTCRPCGERFDTQDALSEHVKAQHPATDDYQCKHCGRPFGH